MERAVPNHETSNVSLRDVVMSDLPIFFEQQLDPDANTMAAFAPKDPADRDAFTAHWTRLLAAGSLRPLAQTIAGRARGVRLRQP